MYIKCARNSKFRFYLASASLTLMTLGVYHPVVYWLLSVITNLILVLTYSGQGFLFVTEWKTKGVYQSITYNGAYRFCPLQKKQKIVPHLLPLTKNQS